MKKETLRIIVIFLITIGAVYWALNFVFFNKLGPRSKAGGETVDVIYDPASSAPTANADFNVSLRIKPSVDVTLRGYYIKIPFNKTHLKVKNIEYKVGVASADLSNTNSDLTTINQNGVLELYGEIQNNIGQIVSVSATGTDLVNLTFSALSTTGNSFQAEVKFYLVDSNGLITEANITSVPKYDVNGGGTLVTAVSCTPFTDNFSVGGLGLNWLAASTFASSSAITVASGEANLKITGVQGQANSLHIISKNSITGDFVAEVLFKSLNAATASGGSLHFDLTPVSSGGNGTRFMVVRQSGNPTLGVGTNNSGGGDNYSTENLGIGSNTPVKIKIERVGAKINTYYNLQTGQGYKLIKTYDNVPDVESQLYITVNSFGPDNPSVTGVIDDFNLTCSSGAAISPTLPPGTSPTLPPGTISPTVPPVTGNVKINLKLKLQGINSKPSGSLGTTTIKVKVRKEGATNSLETTGVFTANENGIWSGRVGFDIADLTGKYLVYIKGPQHLQKKVCDAAPTETTAATYRCADGNITLVAGENNLDFSKIVFLVGDLDQSGIIDSVDLGLVRNNLGKTDAALLAKADLNRDGRISTQDFSLIIVALSIRTDEL